MKDYYAILGVPREAEADLIKANYLALSKIYHPDIYKGDKKYALKRMQEINEAYEILKDPKKRKAYDQKNKDTADESSFDENEFQDEQSSYQDIIKEAWGFAKEYYPSIEIEYSDLSKINRNLAWQFQVLCVETKSFDNADTISKRLKDDWLQKRFGKKKKLQELALKAILENQIIIAKEINKIFKILGDKDVDMIIEGLEKKFPDFFQINERTSPADKDTFFYKKFGYRLEKNISKLIYPEGAWIITHAPKNSSIGFSFESEKSLKDYINKQV